MVKSVPGTPGFRYPNGRATVPAAWQHQPALVGDWLRRKPIRGVSCPGGGRGVLSGTPRPDGASRCSPPILRRPTSAAPLPGPHDCRLAPLAQADPLPRGRQCPVSAWVGCPLPRRSSTPFCHDAPAYLPLGELRVSRHHPVFQVQPGQKRVDRLQFIPLVRHRLLPQHECPTDGRRRPPGVLPATALRGSHATASRPWPPLPPAPVPPAIAPAVVSKSS